MEQSAGSVAPASVSLDVESETQPLLSPGKPGNGVPQEQEASVQSSSATAVLKPGMSWLGQSEVLVAGTSYCLISTALVLLNKHVLASFGFDCPILMLTFQCVIAVALVFLTTPLSSVPVEPLRWSLVRVWLPANLLFVGMMVTSFCSLQLITIGAFTVLKNLSNLITIVGDYVLFGHTYDYKVWLCLVLMMISALCGGMTDLRFNLEGYAWQILNCFFAAGSHLYLSGAMKATAAHTTNKERLSEISMVYYNNILSIPPLCLLALARGEWQILVYQRALDQPPFLVAALMAAFLGFGISFTSLWYLSRSTATIFGLTGSLTKILIAVVGIIIFAEPTTPRNLASIAVGLAAGVALGLAKSAAKK